MCGMEVSEYSFVEGPGDHDAVIKQEDAVLCVDGLADRGEGRQGRVVDFGANFVLDEVQQVAKTWGPLLFLVRGEAMRWLRALVRHRG